MNASRLLALGALALAAGCTQPDPPATPGGAPPLLASVQASTFGADSVVFTLQVTNTAPSPLVLEFASGQSYDFVVLRGTQEVWRWAGDRMFTQALRSETLPPGATNSYTATWAPVPVTAGEYTVRAMLTARNAAVEQTTRFRL